MKKNNQIENQETKTVEAIADDFAPSRLEALPVDDAKVVEPEIAAKQTVPESPTCHEDICKKFHLKSNKQCANKKGKIIAAVVVPVLAIGAILSGVFGASASYAKENTRYTKATAKDTAVAYATTNYASSGASVWVKDVDRNLEVTPDLDDSYYRYVVDVVVGNRTHLELSIDGRTGETIVIDLDYND